MKQANSIQDVFEKVILSDSNKPLTDALLFLAMGEANRLKSLGTVAQVDFLLKSGVNQNDILQFIEDYDDPNLSSRFS